jgi:tRNA(fMet)-specific endonuclease VapC
MARLIDSSVVIALERQGWPLGVLLATAPDESWAMSSITAAELLLEVERADSRERRRRRATVFEAVLADVPVRPFDLGVARVHARFRAQLLDSSRLIGAHDLLIAATALTHGYAMLTQNLRDFRRVPGHEARQPEWAGGGRGC